MRDSILYMFWAPGSRRHFLNRASTDPELFKYHDTRERSPVYVFINPLPDYSVFTKRLRKSEDILLEIRGLIP